MSSSAGRSHRTLPGPGTTTSVGHASSGAAPLLLTPGPVSLSPGVRAAMARDRTSGEPEVVALLAEAGLALHAIAGGDQRYAAVPMPGSASAANEAVMRSLVPPGGKLLVCTNGVYGDWLVALAAAAGRPFEVLRALPLEPLGADRMAGALDADAGLTHVMLVHLETSSGLLNPLEPLAAVCRSRARGLLIDAVASFGAHPIDVGELGLQALVTSSNKCLEGPPGMAWVLVRQDALEAGRGHAGSLCLDLWDQHQHVARTGLVRFTPPVHALLGTVQALREHAREGCASRLARYVHHRDTLRQHLDAAGWPGLLPAEQASPVLHAFRASARLVPGLVHAMAEAGFILAPGRLAVPDTVRIGCMGALSPMDVARAADRLVSALAGPRSAAPEAQTGA